MIKNRTSERGDTLIEVLLALSVMGVVVVGAVSLMNKGLSQMYDTMERSAVQLLLDRQVEILTYGRDQRLRELSGESLTGYDEHARSLWNQVRTVQSLNAGAVPQLNNCSDTNRAFAVANNNGGGFSVLTSVQAVATEFPSPANGIWIQKIHNGTVSVPYTDFYIRACWRQSSSPVNQVASTVVRLYDRN